MFAKIAAARRWIGGLWGHTTTQLINALIGIQAALAEYPALVASNQYLVFAPLGIAVAVAILRVLCPPPPSIPVHPEDTVENDATNNQIIITKGS